MADLTLKPGRVGDRRSITIESRLASTGADKNPASATMLVFDEAIITSGTADSGSTTKLVDTALTQANDFWNGITLEVTHASGTVETTEVTDFTAADDTLVFGAIETAVAAGDTYRLLGYPVLTQADATVSGNEVSRVGTADDVFSRDRTLTVIARFTFSADDIQECCASLPVYQSLVG